MCKYLIKRNSYCYDLVQRKLIKYNFDLKINKNKRVNIDEINILLDKKDTVNLTDNEKFLNYISD